MRLGHLFVVIALTALAFAVGAPVYWAFLDTTPPFRSVSVEITNSRGRVLSYFLPGETMFVSRGICSDRQLPVTSSRRLIRDDGVSFILQSAVVGELRRGCFSTGTAQVIPNNIPPGRYRYSVVVQYDQNILQTGVVELTSPVIEIL